MGQTFTDRFANKILEVSELRFTRVWLKGEVHFDIGEDRELTIPSIHLIAILSDDEYTKVCAAFIEKLSNLSEFMNDDYISTFRLPNELMIRCGMLGGGEGF